MDLFGGCGPPTPRGTGRHSDPANLRSPEPHGSVLTAQDNTAWEVGQMSSWKSGKNRAGEGVSEHAFAGWPSVTVLIECDDLLQRFVVIFRFVAGVVGRT